MRLHRRRLLLCFGGAMLALFTGLAHAAAGRVLYTVGPVELHRAGQTIAAQRGTTLEPGDQIVVGAKSRAQLRMSDGALIALQPSSTLAIDQFSYTSAAPASASSQIGSSVLRLLKGGLRTITGLIGKRAGDTYQVNTTVATIGVRGTDYRMALCQGDCAATPDGLYIGVSDGSVVVSNGAGELVLADDEFAWVGSSDSAPQRLLAPPSVLETVLDGQGGGPPFEGEIAGGPGGPDDCHCTLDENDPGYHDVVIPDKLLGSQGDLLVAHSTSSPSVAPVGVGAGVIPNPPGNVDDAGHLTSFQGLTGSGPQAFQLGGGVVSNVGFDPETGMRWGRWSETVQIAGSPVNLDNHDLHWITGAQTDAVFALPITGTANYDLVGNTNPTDNLGHVGFLGSASLSADFTNQTLTNSVNLTINDQVWSATGMASLHSPVPLFGGNYSTVTVGGQQQGTGSFAGFFVPGSGGQSLPAGAGLTYNLNNGGTTVNGAATFGARH